MAGFPGSLSQNSKWRKIFGSAPYRRGMVTILSALVSLLSFRVRRRASLEQRMRAGDKVALASRLEPRNLDSVGEQVSLGGRLVCF